MFLDAMKGNMLCLHVSQATGCLRHGSETTQELKLKNSIKAIAMERRSGEGRGL